MPRYEIVSCNDEGISRCAEKTRSGAVIVFPTDTVYGIGCDPYNDSAVARIFALKSRTETKPLPVLVRNQNDAEKIVDLGEKGRMLAVKYWPGKLTILAPVLDRSISSKVTAGGTLLGVRVPSNKCALDLLEKCRYLVGTSANISGRPPLRSAGDVRASGLAGFDILLDGGRIAESKESTVFDTQRLQVVRQGALSEKSIFETIGEC